MASSYAPHLRREHFVEIMGVIGGQQRVTNMIPEDAAPSQNYYDQYFERLRTLRWLNLDS